MSRDRSPRQWPLAVAWVALAAFIIGGSWVLIDLLHPNGKRDPRGVVVVVFALLSAMSGILVIMRWQSRR